MVGSWSIESIHYPIIRPPFLSVSKNSMGSWHLLVHLKSMIYFILLLLDICGLEEEECQVNGHGSMGHLSITPIGISLNQRMSMIAYYSIRRVMDFGLPKIVIEKFLLFASLIFKFLIQ